jgi:1-acyl-sn-glycerol-3-phosphate acyltransferase
MPFYPAMVQAAIDVGVMVQPVAIRYLDLEGRLNATVPFTGDQTFIDSLRRILREPAIIADLYFGNPLSAAVRTRRELTASTLSRRPSVSRYRILLRSSGAGALR